MSVHPHLPGSPPVIARPELILRRERDSCVPRYEDQGVGAIQNDQNSPDEDHDLGIESTEQETRTLRHASVIASSYPLEDEDLIGEQMKLDDELENGRKSLKEELENKIKAAEEERAGRALPIPELEPCLHPTATRTST